MTLEFILEQAKSGELEQLSKANKTDRVIVSYINLAKIALNNRFQLETEEALITLHPAKSLYRLDGTDPDVTVNGNPMPTDDVLSITHAYEEDGTPISINDTADPYSVLTPSYNSIQVPVSGVDNTTIAVIYTRNPSLITSADVTYVNDTLDTASLQYDIGLPLALSEPMLHYIGYRAHGSRNGSIQAENNTHLMRFKASCNEIEALGVLPNKEMLSRDIKVKGFV